MSREQIACMPSHELQAIVRSTNPAGKYWLEYQMACDELARREAEHARRVCRVADALSRK